MVARRFEGFTIGQVQRENEGCVLGEGVAHALGFDPDTGTELIHLP